MAEKNLLINELIEFVYQAPNATPGLSDITAEIYLPGNVKDEPNFPDIPLTEIDSTGEYVGSFIPNAEGEWKVIIHRPGSEGQVVKRFSVGAHNVHSVGEKSNSIQAAVADVDADVAVVGGVVTTVDGKVDAIDAKAVSIETKVDNIDTKVSSLDTPPMVS